MQPTTYKALPDGNVLVHIPLRLVRKPQGLRYVSDEDGANRDRNAEMGNLQAVAQGMRYRRIAASDKYDTHFRMASKLGVDPSNLKRVLLLGYLSPTIVEKLANGELTHVSIHRLKSLHTLLWAEQHKLLGIG